MPGLVVLTQFQFVYDLCWCSKRYFEEQFVTEFWKITQNQKGSKKIIENQFYHFFMTMQMARYKNALRMVIRVYRILHLCFP